MQRPGPRPKQGAIQLERPQRAHNGRSDFSIANLRIPHKRNDLPDRATDSLRRDGLLGSPLRTSDEKLMELNFCIFLSETSQLISVPRLTKGIPPTTHAESTRTGL